MDDGWVKANSLLPAAKRKHTLAVAGAEAAISGAVECGEILLEMQNSMPHRQWKRYVDAQIPWGIRQVQRYTKAAAMFSRGLTPATRAKLAAAPLHETVKQQEAEAKQASEDFREQMTADLDESELPDEMFSVDQEDPGVQEAMEESLEVKVARAQYPSDWDDDLDGCPEMTDEVIAALNQAMFLHNCIREANRMRHHIEGRKNNPELSYVPYQNVVALLKDFATVMRDATPRCPCPVCQQRGCDFCTPRGGGDMETKTYSKPLGWIDNWRWKRHVKMRNKAKREETMEPKK